MKSRGFGAALSLVAMLSACGGGGGSGGGTGPISSAPSPSPSPTPTASGACTLRDRQDWAAAQLQEWYLFPETLPSNLNPAAYTTVEDYIDALTANARAQRRDRYFTYLTSISEEDAYYSSGTTAGYGFRLLFNANNQLMVTEAFEGAPALAAGIDRGSEIYAIGTTASNVRTVASIIATEGGDGITAALGPDTPGTTRVFQVRDKLGYISTVTVAKANYDIAPVSSRYGAKIIDDGGQRIGYVNLRTFISPADPALRSAFAQFKAAGVTNIIVDLRYNGGGLISIAELMGDLLGGGHSTSDVLDYTTFRPSKSENNETRTFDPQPQSVAATRIAFIGTGGTASASELVINAFLPYLHANAALIGTNTYGKPVGQIAIDRKECDDRFRIIAFALQNSAHQGDYYDGLATKVEASCQAGDDLTHPLGDPQEASTRSALDFLEGKSCSPIASGGQTAQSLTAKQTLLTPDRATTVQREVPGLF